MIENPHPLRIITVSITSEYKNYWNERKSVWYAVVLKVCIHCLLYSLKYKQILRKLGGYAIDL